jgi:hypothetical protein
LNPQEMAGVVDPNLYSQRKWSLGVQQNLARI